MAAVYSLTCNADQYISRAKIINKGRSFTNLPIVPQFRRGTGYRQTGAWMAMKGMVDKGLFVKTKGGGGPFGGTDVYRLTVEGRKLCYYLFNPMNGKAGCR